MAAARNRGPERFPQTTPRPTCPGSQRCLQYRWSMPGKESWQERGPGPRRNEEDGGIAVRPDLQIQLHGLGSAHSRMRFPSPSPSTSAAPSSRPALSRQLPSPSLLRSPRFLFLPFIGPFPLLSRPSRVNLDLHAPPGPVPGVSAFPAVTCAAIADLRRWHGLEFRCEDL